MSECRHKWRTVRGYISECDVCGTTAEYALRKAEQERDALRQQVIELEKRLQEQIEYGQGLLRAKKMFLQHQKSSRERHEQQLTAKDTALNNLLKTLGPIESHAKFSINRSANSSSAHQEFVREDEDNLRSYEIAKEKVAQALAGKGQGGDK